MNRTCAASRLAEAEFCWRQKPLVTSVKDKGVTFLEEWNSFWKFQARRVGVMDDFRTKWTSKVTFSASICSRGIKEVERSEIGREDCILLAAPEMVVELRNLKPTTVRVVCIVLLRISVLCWPKWRLKGKIERRRERGTGNADAVK